MDYRLWDTVEHAVAAFDGLDRPDGSGSAFRP
jgi:hypothetical protein